MTMLWSNPWLGRLLIIGSLVAAAPSGEPGESGGHGKSTPGADSSTAVSTTTQSRSSTTSNTASTSHTSTATSSTNSSLSTAGSNLQGLSTSSHKLSTGAVGGIVAAAIAGTAIVILGSYLLYRRRVRKSRAHELDLISKDEQRSVGSNSPAAAIDPFASSSNGSNSGYPNVNPYDGVTVPAPSVPSSPAMSYAPDVAPLSLTFSHVPSSIYDNPMTPTSLKSDLPNAGPSDKVSIVQSTPAVREEAELVQEKDGGISLMSSDEGSLRQAVPPAYSDRYNESDNQPSTSRSPFD